MQLKSNRCFTVAATEHIEKHQARFFYLIYSARTVQGAERGRTRLVQPASAEAA